MGLGISGYLAAQNFIYPIIGAAALSAISILCTYFLLPRREQVHLANEANPGPGGKRLPLLDWKGYTKYFAEPAMRRLLVQWFLFAFSFSSFISAFALFAERRYTWQGHPFGVREVGYVFAFSGLVGIIMQGGMVGRMVKWLGEAKLISSGLLQQRARLCGDRVHVSHLGSIGGADNFIDWWSRLASRADQRHYAESGEA